MRICLVLEGSYPYVHGGVSTWMHAYIQAMPRQEFSLWVIGAKAEDRGKFVYELPPNVKEVEEVFLDDALRLHGEQQPVLFHEAERAALRELVRLGHPDWDVLFRLFQQKGVHPLSFLQSRDFMELFTDICLKEYPYVAYADAFHTMRSMLLPVLYLLTGRVPKADVYHAISTGYGGLLACLGGSLNHAPVLLTEHGIYTREREEEIIRAEGAIPATTAIIGGKLKVGLNSEELELMCRAENVGKVSRRDVAVYLSEGLTGATTVATTMMIAELAGIHVFATGGIGGVHRGAETTMDISADLEELAQTPVMVVCAGAKSILDLGLTLEYLETHGVPVIGYQTEELPAFYTRKSGFKVDYRLDTPKQLAEAFHVKRELGLEGGMLVTNPIPEQYSMDADVINKAINEAVEEAKEQGIHGKATTPFLLAKIKDITGGSSLDANIQLVYNNAKLATATACELAKLAK